MMALRPLTFICSPYSGDIDRNVAYARRAVRDSLRRGEAPIAPHLLYTQPGILRDEIPAERDIGVAAGLQWLAACDRIAVYPDLGISPGMALEIEAATLSTALIAYRYLDQPQRI